MPRWLKKAGKLCYGYEHHIAVDENEMIQGVHTTAANAHDGKGLIPLLRELPESKEKEVLIDKEL